MSSTPDGPLSRERLIGSLLGACRPCGEWKVGMELEKMGRHVETGRPLPYDGNGPTVLAALQHLLELRPGEPILEAGMLIGIRASWGTITLEPGGQVEWSSMPRPCLADLERDLNDHVTALSRAGSALGIEWLDVAVDPQHSMKQVIWMPKQRYAIMREYFRTKGKLAHRMMTQSASIQCAYDFCDEDDWKRKFRAAALLAPLVTALFANSTHLDGRDTGYRSYRHMIWRETDDDRCGLPAIVFDDGFDPERWCDWVLDVPLLFRRDGEGLAPPDGRSFRQLLDGPEGPELDLDDWATHCSSVFTEVRCFGYMEVRSADLQPDDRAFAVPTFLTAMLYSPEALDEILEDGAGMDHAGWNEDIASASRLGLDGAVRGRGLREIAARRLGTAVRVLERGLPCGGGGGGVRHLERLASRLGVDASV
jgi:glutamate--cysteine ligase